MRKSCNPAELLNLLLRTSDGKEPYKELPNHKRADTGQSAPREQRTLEKISFPLGAELPTLIKQRKIAVSSNTGRVQFSFLRPPAFIQ